MIPSFRQYSSVSRQDAVQHAQIWLKWEMNWTKERWHFCYWKGFFWVGNQSRSSLLGQVFWDCIMMFALIKVSARTAFVGHLTWGWVVYLCLCVQNTGPIDWGNWSRPGSWCTGSLCTWWNVIFLLRLTSMPGEAYVQNCSVSRVGKAITTNTPTCTKRKTQTLRIVDLGESCKYHQHHIHYHYNFKLYSP